MYPPLVYCLYVARCPRMHTLMLFLLFELALSHRRPSIVSRSFDCVLSPTPLPSRHSFQLNRISFYTFGIVLDVRRMVFFFWACWSHIYADIYAFGFSLFVCCFCFFLLHMLVLLLNEVFNDYTRNIQLNV